MKHSASFMYTTTGKSPKEIIMKDNTATKFQFVIGALILVLALMACKNYTVSEDKFALYFGSVLALVSAMIFFNSGKKYSKGTPIQCERLLVNMVYIYHAISDTKHHQHVIVLSDVQYKNFLCVEVGHRKHEIIKKEVKTGDHVFWNGRILIKSS